MMVYGRCVLVVLSLLLLSACGPRYDVVYRYVPPRSERGMTCVKHCATAKRLCQRVCNSGNSGCLKQARSQARLDYQRYVADQTAAGREPTRTVESFFDSHACPVKQCGCENSYRDCFEMCGGQAIEERRCTHSCNRGT